jgi:uncharacterized protein YndB with AHSA1/START domain
MTFRKITIKAIILTDKKKAWDYYTLPQHIVNWNFASDEWHCPEASNDLVVGGKYHTRMAAKFGDIGFDFGGTYTEVMLEESFTYKLPDDREVSVSFTQEEGHTQVQVVFDAETENTLTLQKQGWQTILNQYKKYTEAN